MRAYLEKERSSIEGSRAERAHDGDKLGGYYRGDGDGLAERHVLTRDGTVTVDVLDAKGFDEWLAGRDPETGEPRGQVRQKGQGWVDEDGKWHEPRDPTIAYEHIIAAPKSLSAMAVVDRDFAGVLRGVQERQREAIERALMEHLVTRRGPAGAQVQVPAVRIETAIVWHDYSRAGDPHAHGHMLINARVQLADGCWRAIDGKFLMNALNGLTNAVELGVLRSDAELARAFAERGWTQDERGGSREVEPLTKELSRRERQIERNSEEYLKQWREENPGKTVDVSVRRAADGYAWAHQRPAKGEPARVTANGEYRPDAVFERVRDRRELTPEWVEAHVRDSLGRQGYDVAARREPVPVREVKRPDVDAIAHDAVAKIAVERATWHTYDVKAAVVNEVARTGWTGSEEDVERLADEAHQAAVLGYCQPALTEEQQLHVKLQTPNLTSGHVLEVEQELAGRMAHRAELGGEPARLDPEVAARLSVEQRAAAAAIAGDSRFVVVEGAAGTGKTHMLAAARDALQEQGRELRVVAPSKVAGDVAGRELDTHGDSVHKLLHAHGVRWDNQGGNWRRLEIGEPEQLKDGSWRHYQGPPAEYRLDARTVLVVDEAGMLGQEEAIWTQRIVDDAGAQLAYVGDRRQLPAVGRGGAFELAVRSAGDGAYISMEDPHRYKTVTDDGRTIKDVEYAELMHQQRMGENPEEVFDRLYERGQIRLAEDRNEAIDTVANKAADRRVADLEAGALEPSHVVPVAGRELAAAINEDTRDRLIARGVVDDERVVATAAGERIGRGDLIVTRQNDRDLDVSNRQLHTVERVERDGSLTVRDTDGEWHRLNAEYVAGRSQDEQTPHVQLAYAQTYNGVQGITAHSAEQLHTQSASAAGLYVGLSRGSHEQTVVMIAGSQEEAREMWVSTTERDVPAPTVTQAREQAQAEVDRSERGARENGRDGRVLFDAFVERERIEADMRDPLADVRLALGPDRADQLPELSDIERMTLRDMTDSELAQAIDERRVPPLDRTTALETWRLERDVVAAASKREQARERLEELQQRRSELGFLQRRDRGGIAADLGRQRRIEENTRARIARDERQIEAYREAGRHPDQWVEEHGAAAVQWAGTIREQQVRQELEIRRAQEIAVLRPPEHVRALLGERTPENRERYDSLTRDLERHRIEHGVDVEHEGGLGPVPPDHGQESRGDYAKARSALTERVIEYRHDHGLDVSGAQYERGHDTGRGMSLDL